MDARILCTSNLAKLFLIIFIVSLDCFAQNVSKTGTTAASFLEIPVGAKGIGMGGAYVSVTNDASSLFWNPAVQLQSTSMKQF